MANNVLEIYGYFDKKDSGDTARPRTGALVPHVEIQYSEFPTKTV